MPADAKTITGAANALPQALILTAIVIGFGLLVFALALAYRSYYVLAHHRDGRDARRRAGRGAR